MSKFGRLYQQKNIVKFADLEGNNFDTEEEALDSTVNIIGEKILSFKEVDWSDETESTHVGALYRYLMNNKEIIDMTLQYLEEKRTG